MSTKWEIYFILIAIQSIAAPAAMVLSGQISNPLAVINCLFIFTGVAGLFGYVHSKNVGPTIFWKIFLPLFIAWDIFFLCIWLPQKSEMVISTELWVLTALLFLFLYPQYLGIYRYGYINQSKT